ncbi:putative Mitogen-activated protein kinase kinase kinase 4 [Hypsibius exemplaris]|uniref:non-specific serine/threonine protein kinase n=1 Tax=Hypsibius exemplaris TaxID=2072580 RepID=A0A1W0X6I5_HYPEX|nr:putative Mitogen-activated protein kinase kinase kinase 4 [Hypsibius exemplaris]
MNSTFNITGNNTALDVRRNRQLLGWIVGILLTDSFGVIANVVLLLALTVHRPLRHLSSRALITNCVAIDLYTTLISVPTSTIPVYLGPGYAMPWRFCRYQAIPVYIAYSAGLHAAAVLAAYRLIAGVAPRIFAIVSRKVAVNTLILLPWCIALTLNIFPTIDVGWKIRRNSVSGGCTYMAIGNSTLPMLIYTTVGIYLPTALTGACYTVVLLKTLCDLRKRRSSRLLHRRLEISRTLFLSFLWHCVTLYPTNIIITFFPSSYSENFGLQLGVRYLGNCFSAINPVFFWASSRMFQNGIREVLQGRTGAVVMQQLTNSRRSSLQAMETDSEPSSTATTVPACDVCEVVRAKFGYEMTEDKPIGRGNAAVFRARRLDSGEIIAVKKIPLPFDEPDIAVEFGRCAMRFKGLMELRHPNVVQHLAMDLLEGMQNGHDPKVAVVMEYCSGGTLYRKSQLAGGLDVASVKRYTRQLIAGIAYLHEKRIGHLDIKGVNVLLTADDTVKICDFGEIVQLQQAATQENEVGLNVGTWRYMSPEMINGKFRRGRSADIWSFGCVLIEMLSGKEPTYRNENGVEVPTANVYYVVGNGGFPDIPDGIGTVQDVYLLLWQCMQTDPSQRPTAQQIARHPCLRWDTELEFDDIEESSLLDEREFAAGHWSAVVRVNGKKRAVRSVSFSLGRDAVAKFLDEVNILVDACRGGHENVMQFFSARLTGPTRLHIVTEYFSNGSLHDLLRLFKLTDNAPADNVSFDYTNCAFITKTELQAVAQQYNSGGSVMINTAILMGLTYQICSALEYLSRKGILYLNLCSQNVCFSDDFMPKLTAFERAVETRPGGSSSMKDCYYPPPAAFHPPEVRICSLVTAATDAWSFGVLLLETFRIGCLSGLGWTEPMETSRGFFSKHEFHYSHAADPRESINPSIILKMLEACFILDSARRPSFSQLLTAFQAVHEIPCYIFYRMGKENSPTPGLMGPPRPSRKLISRSPLTKSRNVGKKRGWDNLDSGL